MLLPGKWLSRTLIFPSLSFFSCLSQLEDYHWRWPCLIRRKCSSRKSSSLWLLSHCSSSPWSAPLFHWFTENSKLAWVQIFEIIYVHTRYFLMVFRKFCLLYHMQPRNSMSCIIKQKAAGPPCGWWTRTLIVLLVVGSRTWTSSFTMSTGMAEWTLFTRLQRSMLRSSMISTEPGPWRQMTSSRMQMPQLAIGPVCFHSKTTVLHMRLNESWAQTVMSFHFTARAERRCKRDQAQRFVSTA